MKNCNYCEHLNLTEEQQHKAGTDKPHICLKYGKRVFHRSTERGYHEMIYPCRECENESLSDSDGKGLSMGRFNLNQILSDTSKAAAGGGSAKPRPSESRYEKLSVFDLVPSEDNFYSMREIGELKAAIEIAGKVLQNLVVVPLGDGKYKVIAGHRRRLASIELVNDGKPEYEFVPCVIEPTEEAADEQEIRDSIQVHRRLGTKYAVEKALGAVYPGTKVEEWFEYGGDPYKFRVVIGATEAGITADRQAAVLDRVRFYKNLRSHLEAISYQIEKRTAVKVAAVHAIGQRVEVYPYLARNMESHGGFYCGGYTQYGRKLAVFPNK